MAGAFQVIATALAPLVARALIFRLVGGSRAVTMQDTAGIG